MHQLSLRHFGIHSWSSSTMLFQCQLTCPDRRWFSELLGFHTCRKINGQLVYLCTSTEAAGVQEREEVEAEGSWQQAGEVSSLQGEHSAHTGAQEAELLHCTAQHKVLKHSRPLAIRPPVKLMTRSNNRMGFLYLHTHTHTHCFTKWTPRSTAWSPTVCFLSATAHNVLTVQ